MKRRTLIKTVGGIARVTAVGGYALTGSAAAQASVGMFGVDETYDIDSESGRVTSLRLENINVTATWEGFDAPVQTVDWTLEVTLNDGDRQQIGTATADGFEPAYENQNGVNNTMGDVDLVNVYSQDRFEVESAERYDGEDVTERFGLVFYLSATVTDSNDDSIQEQASGDTDLGITNLGGQASTGGSGDIAHEDEGAGDYNAPFAQGLTEIPVVPYGEEQDDPTDSPQAQAQYNQLEPLNLPDPFTLKVQNVSMADGQTTEYGVTIHKGSFDQAPEDTLTGPTTPLDYDENGVATVTIGDNGGDVPMLGYNTDDIGTIAVDADRVAVETK